MGTKPIQDDAIVTALSVGASYRQAAKVAGVGLQTVCRRMKCDDFRRRVTDRRTEILGEAAGRITAATKRAVGTLVKLLSSGSDVVRLGASRAILDGCVSLRNLVELEARIEALESSVKK